MSRILGFNISPNFRWPYFSVTPAEFWRRWHISLSFWFRDYVYIPLGGSRAGAWRRWRNLLVTWALCGLWHGAGLRFLVWGIYNGVLVGLSGKIPPAKTRISRMLGITLTFLLTCVGWMFFRAQSLKTALSMIRQATAISTVLPIFQDPVSSTSIPFFRSFPYCGPAAVFFLGLSVIIHGITYRLNYSLEGLTVFDHFLAPFVTVPIVSGVVLLLIILAAGSTSPFIYFVFQNCLRDLHPKGRHFFTG